VPHNIAHFDVPADDVERARRFYERAFGWRFEPFGPPDFYLIHTGSEQDPGIHGSVSQRPEGSVIPYRNQGSGSPNSRFWDNDLNPCQKPPWGFLTAISLDSGDFRWRSVLGVVDELLAKGIPPTGTSNLGGSLVTAGGVLFIGATIDPYLRAFATADGRELWKARLPTSARATPLVYTTPGGREMVAIAAGGHDTPLSKPGTTLHVFALPKP
jgi:quinoprotein glucose dehydrogenase